MAINLERLERIKQQLHIVDSMPITDKEDLDCRKVVDSIRHIKSVYGT